MFILNTRVNSLLKVKRAKWNSNSLLGINITADRITAVELTGSLEQPILISKAMRHHASVTKEDVTLAIADLLAELTSYSTQVAVALPESTVISKVFDMSAKLNKFELEEQVNIEALHCIPYPLDEVYLDFTIVGQPDECNQKKVLMVACRREHVDQQISCFAGCGLKLAMVDVDRFALERVQENGFKFDYLANKTLKQSERNALAIATGLSLRGLH